MTNDYDDDFMQAWLSGKTKRYHVMEVIKENLVSEHTWGVVLLLLMMWPDAPKHLIIAALLHDFGEKATGDMPGPVKWDNEVLEAEMDRMERAHMRDCLPSPLLSFVEMMSPVEWGLVELCDRAEFCFNMVYERKLGNRYAEIYYKRAWDKMSRTLDEHRPEFQKMGTLVQGVVGMRRNLDENWRLARGVAS